VAGRVKKKHLAKYGGCLVCGRVQVDLAHVVPAGPYPELKKELENLVPLCRWHHTVFDIVPSSKLSERLEWLKTHCRFECGGLLEKQLEALAKVAQARKVSLAR